MFNLQLHVRFYLGMVFIIVSLILGALAKISFIIYLNNEHIRWTSIIIYIISWPLLIIGGWWVGSEYYCLIKRYVSYKFYHEKIKSGTKTIYQQTEAKGKKIHTKVKAKIPKKKR